jgi:hypothetical protein
MSGFVGVEIVRSFDITVKLKPPVELSIGCADIMCGQETTDGTL